MALLLFQVLATFLSLKIKEVDWSENSKKPVKMSRQERLKRFSKRERKVRKVIRPLCSVCGLN